MLALIGQNLCFIRVYIITKSMRVIVPVNPRKNRRIRKPLACGWWYINSSRVLPTSRVVYQLITHRNLRSIA